MLNIIICEDNSQDMNNIMAVVQEFMEKNKLKYKVFSYNDYNKNFIKMIQEKLPSKIYLLDIETPSASGIDIAREIRKKDVESVIIFLTGHEELGNVVLKNDLMFLSFINKFDNLKNRLNRSLRKSLDLLYKGKVIKFTDGHISYTINANDIIYITKESFERKTIIKTDYGEFKVNKSLREIIKMLDSRFIQTHRACYINIDRKVKVNKTTKIILFDNGEEIDLLSEKYKKELV